MQTLSQSLHLSQKLTPQQVQYLKLLQLPIFALEQRIKEELETNVLLEEDDSGEENTQEAETAAEKEEAVDGEKTIDEGYTFEDYMNDELSGYKAPTSAPDDEDREEIPMPDEVSLSQHLTEQLRLLNLSPDEELLGEEINGNIDEDGYLRRDLALIVQDLNLDHGLHLTVHDGEEVLKKIQRLDPPGIGSRDLRECLLVQLELRDDSPLTKSIAMRVLRDHWDLFSMKHYDELRRRLNIDSQRLKNVVSLIQKLNPKPGEGEFTPQQNYLIPDFLVERDGEDFIIQLNERGVPPLRVNKRYKEIMAKRKTNGANTDVRDFVKKQFDAAKWFIASIHQRRETMMKVMQTIVDLQRTFFETGENLKPMIYKDIADIIGMDISTISRVVNGKYVQCEYGVFELRHFFSDSIRTVTGEEISNKEVKKIIQEIIEKENSDHPMSDDRIAEMLRGDGMNIARRTVAKYREALGIPVARLRKSV